MRRSSTRAGPTTYTPGPSLTLDLLDAEFITQQRTFGAQSCRGLSSPDLSPLGGNKHAVKVFRQMLARETALAGEWACFYHSYNSPALVYEVQAAVAKVLFNFGARHGVLPRLLKSSFEHIPDAAAMLKAFPTWPDQDHNVNFKRVGICCSTSLASPDPEATPTHMFMQGYGVSVVGINVVEKLLADCGTPRKDVKKLAQKVFDLAKEYGLPQATGSTVGLTGHLLQIFINRSCVDKWAYASLPMGVPDPARWPLSKALAKDGIISGQARLTVNPSAFMRARAVRLYAYSADQTFHSQREAFQKALFDTLAPILGCAEVRESAARGIYGGQLPQWWRDLETERAATNEVGGPEQEREELAQQASGESSPACQQRKRCRYGQDCYRKTPQHRQDFAHPGDLDWEQDGEEQPEVAENMQQQEREASVQQASKQDNAECLPRNRCRYGGDCRRKTLEHCRAFSHPGDPDWEQDGEERPEVCETAHQLEQDETAQQDGKKSNALCPHKGRCKYGADCRQQDPEHCRDVVHQGDPKWGETAVPRRPYCRYGIGCYRKGSEHCSRFAHPGDADWHEPSDVSKSSDTNRGVLDEAMNENNA
mmetsp:Transcript_95132/g.188467  ORF Transcript_95132/g.188467 Transcript_95132/m.188467 type:complete len:594 (+) Transcript_95132:96-1877(+)